MPRRSNSGGKTRIESFTHRDRRTNIPTEELRDFVADDEQSPNEMLYPRDPSLDPQLVWKGKDELDGEDLSVPVVPVYIQEKIHPQALIEELRRTQAGEAEGQMDFFADFNGIEFEQLIDFYQHDQNWSNRMVLGDSLLVMTSLAEKEGLKGQVQTIYMDPPYGIKFGSNWQVSTRKRDVRDGRAEDLTRQPEMVKAFRDTWQLGIHSYLTYLRDRFAIARDLLAETGSIFVQIGDENVHLVRAVLDEVFGSENFCAEIAFTKTTGLGTKLLPAATDYVLWYAKSKDNVKYRQLFIEKVEGATGATQYDWARSPEGTVRRVRAAEPILEDEEPFHIGDASAMFTTPHLALPVSILGRTVEPPRNRQWQTTQEGMSRLNKAARLHLVGNSLRYVRLMSDFPVFPISSLWSDTGVSGFGESKVYVVQTNTKVIQRCVLMTSDPGDLVLDPTCGSGTTALVAEHWGRRWITIDTSRVALTLARTRLMSARFPYYILADSPEGRDRQIEESGESSIDFSTPPRHDLRQGFVFKRAPHVVLRGIAANDEIDVIWARWQERLESLRSGFNKVLGQSWEEWEVPRQSGQDWPQDAVKAHREWWECRKKRQREIDESIARHSESEVLYDQPYEDNKRVRVTGPFTVESLSPHRVVSTDQEVPDTQHKAEQDLSSGQFVLRIIENLRKAGVQNTKRNERLEFDHLDQFAGAWIQASGEYADSSGQVRRVAISIGPEYGTVGSEQVKEAAKEAVKGTGFDMLVVCGFAFDAHAGETAKEFGSEEASEHEFAMVAEEPVRYGRLPVMLAQMNPDLSMGDELLKKTGAGNLFMVFGEPDVQIDRTDDNKVVVEIRGVDVYDPMTGQVRSSSTDDIACWFIDTSYNEESFFVRHAYFTGGDEPYDRLKRALRAEIDEAAWSLLNSTKSCPFDPPATGKIAIKVINHYGDEVMKVYEA